MFRPPSVSLSTSSFGDMERNFCNSRGLVRFRPSAPTRSARNSTHSSTRHLIGVAPLLPKPGQSGANTRYRLARTGIVRPRLSPTASRRAASESAAQHCQPGGGEFAGPKPSASDAVGEEHYLYHMRDPSLRPFVSSLCDGLVNSPSATTPTLQTGSCPMSCPFANPNDGCKSFSSMR
jgi:hypothetical protein